MKAKAISPAKVILFGEHFVVDGNSAISMAIDLPTTVIIELLNGRNIEVQSHDLGVNGTFSPSGELLQCSGENAETSLRPIFEVANFALRKFGRDECGLKIMVASKVPIGMGLGSSAATAVATVSAIATIFDRTLTKDEIFDAAYSLERIVHGHPSGVDQATVTHGGLIVYKIGSAISNLQVTAPPSLIIGNTLKRRSTGDLVGRVRRLRDEDPGRYNRLASEAQRLANHAVDAIRECKDGALGALMNANQSLLELVGVSSPELENLINAARNAGALGAKLTGGGGGGCMIAVVRESDSIEVSRHIEEAGGQIIPGTFAATGVRAYMERN